MVLGALEIADDPAGLWFGPQHGTAVIRGYGPRGAGSLSALGQLFPSAGFLFAGT